MSGIQISYLNGGVTLTVITPVSALIKAERAGLAVLSPVELDLAIRRRLHLRLAGQDFRSASAEVRGDPTRDMVTWQTKLPSQTSEIEITDRLFPEDVKSSTLITVLRSGKTEEFLLDGSHPSLSSARAAKSKFAIALRFAREGIGHIFSGIDHILFVLGLLFLPGAMRSLLKTVTAFTLAHSVTLSLAATGVVSPSSRWVEPIIALSIVAVAVENLRSMPQFRISPEQTAYPPTQLSRFDLRPMLAFGFGLIHGFGFAGGLTDVGLPREGLGVALASFNIGVEIGQVSIICFCSPVLNLLWRNRPAFACRAITVASVIVGLLGASWFFERISGA